jgi:anti-sigma factor RsiW
MSRIDCEQTRDLLPLLTRGQLLATDKAAVDAHLDECADCAAEAALVAALAAAPVGLPVGLEARVLVAVRRPVRATWAPGRLAMAATLAAAVVGGSVVFERWRTGDVDTGPTLVLEDSSPPAVSWGVSEDPLLRDGSSLATLSVEELELILEELDS